MTVVRLKSRRAPQGRGLLVLAVKILLVLALASIPILLRGLAIPSSGNSNGVRLHKPGTRRNVALSGRGQAVSSPPDVGPPPPKVIDPATNTVLEPPYGTSKIRLIVMTYDRAHSVRRLLKSLAEANFYNETANLDIWIDRRSDTEVHKGSVQKSKLPGTSGGGNDNSSAEAVAPPHSPEVVREAESLVWPHGRKTIHLREENVGLVRQWHETWNLSLIAEGVEEGLTHRTREKVLILEDDLEVSPHFWRWLRWCHHAYGDRPDFAACTLQRAQLCAAGCGSGLGGGPDSATPNFMYPLVGSWGYSPSASHWVNFTSWYNSVIASGQKPYVDGLTPTSWYKSRESKCPGSKCRMWTQHHIKYCDTHQDRHTVYVKAGGKAGKTTLSANWQEGGLNFGGKAPSARSDFPRVQIWDEDTLGRFEVEPTRLNWSAKPKGGGEGQETSWNESR